MDVRVRAHGVDDLDAFRSTRLEALRTRTWPDGTIDDEVRFELSVQRRRARSP